MNGTVLPTCCHTGEVYNGEETPELLVSLPEPVVLMNSGRFKLFFWTKQKKKHFHQTSSEKRSVTGAHGLRAK